MSIVASLPVFLCGVMDTFLNVQLVTCPETSLLIVKCNSTKERILTSCSFLQVVIMLLFCPLENEPEEELVKSYPVGTPELLTLTDWGSHVWRKEHSAGDDWVQVPATPYLIPLLWDWAQSPLPGPSPAALVSPVTPRCSASWCLLVPPGSGR